MENFSIIDDPDSSVYGTSRLSALEPLRQVVDEADLAAARRDDLETENLILRRNMPRLRDLQGKDITNEIVLLEENLRAKEDRLLVLQGLLDEERKKTCGYKETERRLLERHQEQMREFTDKYEQLRRTVEEEDPVSAVRETADKLVEESLRARAVELEAWVASDEEVVVSLRQENQELREAVEDLHQKLEQAEQGRAALGYEYQEAVRQLQEKEQQFRAQNKVINGLRKLLPPGLDEKGVDWRNIDFESRRFCVKKLLATVNVLDPRWEENRELKHQLELFVDSARGGDEEEQTMSQVVDELSREREQLGQELMTVDDRQSLDQYFGDVSPIPSTGNADESVREFLNQTTPLVESVDWLRRRFTVMFTVLKGIPEFLDKLLEELDVDDPRIAALIEKINVLKVDFGTSLTEMSENLQTVDTLAADLNESIAALDKSLPNPALEPDRNTLLDEIQALRANMKKEIAAKDETRVEKDRQISQLHDELDALRRHIEAEERGRQTLEEQLQDKDEAIRTLETRIAAANEALLETRKAVDEQETLREYVRRCKGQLELLLEEKTDWLEAVQARDERLAEYEEQTKELQEREELISDLAKNLERLESRGVRVETVNSQRCQADSNYDKIRRIAEQLHNDRDQYANYLARLNRALTTGDVENLLKPEVIDEQAHAVFVELLRGTDPQVMEKLSKAHTALRTKMEAVNSARSDDRSTCSDVSDAVASTLDEIIRSFVECREVANHVVQLLKLKTVDADSTKVSYGALLDKMRELRNKLHLSIKALQTRRERVASRAGTMVVDELTKIHNVLKDVERTTKRVKNKDQLREAARKYKT